MCVVLQVYLYKTYISATSLRRQIVKLTMNNTEATELHPALTNWLLLVISTVLNYTMYTVRGPIHIRSH